MKLLRILAAGALAIALLAAGPVLAQSTTTTTTTTIDLNLKPWIDLAFDCLKIVALALATAIAGYIGRKFGQKWSAETQATVRDSINSMLQAGLQRAQASVPTANIEHVEVQNDILGRALKYAVDNGPALLKKAGIDPSTPEGQREILEKLESLQAPALMVAASSKDQVSVATAATIANPAVPVPPPVVIPVPVPVDGATLAPTASVAQATADAQPPR